MFEQKDLIKVSLSSSNRSGEPFKTAVVLNPFYISCDNQYSGCGSFRLDIGEFPCWVIFGCALEEGRIRFQESFMFISNPSHVIHDGSSANPSRSRRSSVSHTARQARRRELACSIFVHQSLQRNS